MPVPALKKDLRYKRRFIVRSVVLALPPLLALVVMWRNGGDAERVAWVAGGFFLLWMLAWVVLDVWMLRRYRCPACGLRIPAPDAVHRAAGQPIRYTCDRCQIEWDTGLREAGDD